MSKKILQAKLFYLFGIFLLSQQMFSQLNSFTLTVTATNETCTANGALSFNVTNTAPGAIIIYRVFKLPDTVTPIAVTNTNNFGGLTAGTYQVVAIQSLGNLSNTQQQNIQITNLITPVTFQIAGQPAAYCGQTATMTINTQSGSPVAYEIISGPMLVPLQPSNVFTGLPPGDYDVRVIDACGDGVVQTYHLQPPPPNLTGIVLQDCALVDCNTKSLSVRVIPTSGTAIGYPLQVQLTLVQPGTPPIILTQTVTSGNGSLEEIFYNIPYLNIPGYVASVKITDGCNNVLTINTFALDMTPTAQLHADSVDKCTQRLDLSVCNMLPPYNVQFLEAPAGFNPIDFNPGNLGPFAETPISYVSNAQHELPEGHYVVEVTDSCGRTAQGFEDVVKGITDRILFSRYISCVIHNYIKIPDHGISPATVILISAPPAYTGPVPEDLSANISGGIFIMELPVLGTYVFTGINVCGDPYTVSVTVLPPTPPFVTGHGGQTSGCGANNGTATVTLQGGPPIASVIMTQAPAGYNHAIPYDVSAFILDPNCTVHDLMPGDYTFVVTDSCGTVYPPVTVTVVPGALQDLPAITFLRGCEIGNGSMRMISANGRFVTVKITAAPPTFNFPLPYDVSFNLDASGTFYMNSFPEGNYTFYTKDFCDVEHTQDIAMLGMAVAENSIDVMGNCGSFNLRFRHVAYQPFIHDFWLQRLNPVTNQWEHPITGVPYMEGTPPSGINSYPVTNLITNYNIASLGTFRILKYGIIFSNGSSAQTKCYTVIQQFDFTGELKIVSTGAVPCSNSSYDVFIAVEGIAPFTYKITTKDGQPFNVNNGNSNIFSGLAPGIYNFQVEDVCGNIVNRLLDITTLSQPQVFANNLCVGQNGQLSVQAISFLSYQWYRADTPGTILSTTNTLDFAPFSNATSPGTYIVHIYSTTNLSCINRTISYVVPAAAIPNAGLDGVQSICGNANPVDLFAFLGTPYDTGGTWTETTASGGILNGSTWSPNGIQYGIYYFNYKVDSACGASDNATISLHYNPIPPDPVITAETGFCANTSMTLQVDSIPNATYHWTGPNNFSSDLQNPNIENTAAVNGGEYTVTATVDGCISAAAVTLQLLPSPDYKLVSGCINGVFSLTVVPNNNSFDTPSASYAWTGPKGYTNTENPIQLSTSGPGFYQVAVTNTDGCTSAQSILVQSTLCSIPNVITPNDGDDINQSFDLSGLDVVKLEIYSRWGRLVYEQNNYIDQWFGQNMHNKELPDSTYYYIIYLRDQQPKEGWIYKTAWQ